MENLNHAAPQTSSRFMSLPPSQRLLGDDALCQIRTPPNVPPNATVEVIAARGDLDCEIAGLNGKKLKRTTEAIMQVFLSKEFVTRSGHILLSSAELAEGHSDA
jgi:hypothetical protein